MPVAPVVAQLNMLLAPELMLVGFAAKEVIAGLVPLPVVPPEELTEPQPASARQTPSETARALKGSHEKESSFREILFPSGDLEKSMPSPSATAGHTSLVSRELRAYWPQVQKRTADLYLFAVIDWSSQGGRALA